MAAAIRPRTIKKLEKPRPLKISQRNPVDDVVLLIDNVATHLDSKNFDQTLENNVVTMCNHLKLHSHQLEALYKDQLDRAFISIRNGSQDKRLNFITRVHLLELIELRAKQWHQNESTNAYYAQRLFSSDNQIESVTPDVQNTVLPPTLSGNSMLAPVLSPSDVLKNSGKFPKPTLILGKNYFKDEVVIHNSDSGKVNPGAKERHVQITGPSEDKIIYAEELIKDTIQRNASPIRVDHSGREKSTIDESSSSVNSKASDESNRLHQHASLRSSLLPSESANDTEYKYTVCVGSHSLKITGSNLDLVRAAKLALDEFFSEESEHTASGVEYFTFDEETLHTPVTPTTPQITSSAGQNDFVKRNVSFDVSSSKDTKDDLTIPEIDPKKSALSRELSYDFLMQCAKGPFAKRPPSDWDRIQKECPNIVRNKATIRWFEPEAYKTKVAAAGFATVMSPNELLENDAE